MFVMTNKTGYTIILPKQGIVENNKSVTIESIKEIPEVEDIALVGFRENRDAYIFMTEYQRDSFGDIICEYRLNYYLF